MILIVKLPSNIAIFRTTSKSSLNFTRRVTQTVADVDSVITKMEEQKSTSAWVLLGRFMNVGRGKGFSSADNEFARAAFASPAIRTPDRTSKRGYEWYSDPIRRRLALSTRQTFAPANLRSSYFGFGPICRMRFWLQIGMENKARRPIVTDLFPGESVVAAQSLMACFNSAPFPG
jgi:hypothetical protein